jgi:NADPH:quinone reductase-like Zn-dependent oxidoreductase
MIGEAGYAEQVVVPADRAVPLPDSWTRRPQRR